MALINEVKKLCDRLGPLGWQQLLKDVTGGVLDIIQPTADQLKTELTGNLAVVDRNLPGFADFNEGRRGITAGDPSRSLLYHALASPHVLRDSSGAILAGFPTAKEIETVENYVFAVEPRTLNAIRVQAGGGPLSIVVFAYEYRAVADTADGKHADLVFSRTGIARIGTARSRYDPMTRGFWPEDDANPHAFRVIPVRFSAWLAARTRGNLARVMRLTPPDAGENGRDFWIPVHKLFDGPECLSGLDLDLDYKAEFFNLKLQRIRLALGEQNPPSTFPLVIREGLAKLALGSELGRAVVEPVVQERLVEPAMVNGKPLTFKVPPGPNEGFATYTTPFDDENGMEIHPYPAYVHARTQITNNGRHNLNDEVDPNEARRPGNYEALHYIDFTGEGWVTVSVAQLAAGAELEGRPRAAYVLLSAPDFFPSCGQRELSRWNSSKAVPAKFRDGQLWGVPPEPLSETRLPANLQLPGTPFLAEDDAMTAVVGMGRASAGPALLPPLPDVARASTLPDDAAGVFAPGWDASVDILIQPQNKRVAHLTAYGLGSPFPEDAKLCAALSTFWPAVAPDVYRTMSVHSGNPNLRGTVAPLTDEEIGQTGSLPWDGIRGPEVVVVNGVPFLEMASFLHVDYVAQAVENRFSLRLTARVSSTEYENRVLSAARVHFILSGQLNVRPERTKWLFLSFRAVSSGDPELHQAQSEAALVLRGPVYRVEACSVSNSNPPQPSPRGVRWKRIRIEKHNFFFVSPIDSRALRRRSSDVNWVKSQAE